MVQKRTGLTLDTATIHFAEPPRPGMFETACKRIGTAFRKLGSENLTIDAACKDAELKLNSVEITATARFMAIALTFLGFMMYLVYSTLFGHTVLMLLFIVVTPPLVAYMYLTSYPTSAANKILIKAAPHDPVDIGLMCTMIELNNNLYDASKYVAEQGIDETSDVEESRIARKLRTGLYHLSVTGKYHSESKMLNEVGKSLGPKSDHLRSALRNIDTACSRADHHERLYFLRRALSKVLEGVKGSAHDFKDKLVGTHRAIIFLSCMLPLTLIAMLPAMGAMGVEVNPILIVVILAAGVAMTSIVGSKTAGSRPATFAPPDVPRDAPGLPASGRFFVGGAQVPAVILLIMVFFAPAAPTLILFRNAAISLELAGILILFAVAWSGSVYAWASTKDLAKEMARAEAIEAETSDTLMEIKTNIEEGGSVESAVCEAAQKRENTAMGEVLARARFNLLGSQAHTFHDVLFDKSSGAMRTVYSRTVRALFRALSTAARKSAQSAAKVAEMLAHFFDDLGQIKRNIKRELRESVSTIMITARFLLPLTCGMVAGITWGLAHISQKTASEFGEITLMPAGFAQFIFFALAFFVLAMAVVYCNYATNVEVGKNKVRFAQRITQTLPIVPVVFAMIYFATTTLFQSLI